MMKELIIYKFKDEWYHLDVNNQEEGVQSLNLVRIPNDALLVSFQVDQLIAALHESVILDLSILDLESLDRQVNQEGRDGKRDFSKWSVMEMIKFYLKRDELSYGKEDYLSFMKDLVTCFIVMKNKSKVEWDRVLCVEIPVNRVLLASEKAGIRIANSSNIQKQCQSLKHDIYGIKNQMQLEYGIYQADVNAFLEDDLEDMSDITRKLEYISFFGTEDKKPIADLFLQLRKRERDFHCLLCLDSYRDDEMLRPSFQGFGTITSRIVVKNPSLQNLSRRFRHLIKEPYKKYLYIDYSQYEAGILAASYDLKKLKTLYRKGIIYKKLSEMVGVDEDKAKILFYRFMYGGKIDDKKAKDFFEIYCPSNIIKKEVDNIYAQGFAESSFGNRRNVVTDEKPNWLLNHVIQSNASLIFKYALIEVAEKYPMLKLILPMHDAALYALPYGFCDVDGVKKCFIKAYQKVFPGFIPLIKEKDFFAE